MFSEVKSLNMNFVNKSLQRTDVGERKWINLGVADGTLAYARIANVIKTAFINRKLQKIDAVSDGLWGQQ